jgi:hypothetical protein
MENYSTVFRAATTAWDLPQDAAQDDAEKEVVEMENG